MTLKLNNTDFISQKPDTTPDKQIKPIKQKRLNRVSDLVYKNPCTVKNIEN